MILDAFVDDALDCADRIDGICARQEETSGMERIAAVTLEDAEEDRWEEEGSANGPVLDGAKSDQAEAAGTRWEEATAAASLADAARVGRQDSPSTDGTTPESAQDAAVIAKAAGKGETQGPPPTAAADSSHPSLGSSADVHHAAL